VSKSGVFNKTVVLPTLPAVTEYFNIGFSHDPMGFYDGLFWIADCNAGEMKSYKVYDCPEPCPVDSCANGGTCTNKACVCTAKFKGPSCTSCADGWTGTSCATSVNDCLPQPCKNGGVCIDGHLNYTCACSPGYTGRNCTVDINECAPVTCQNGGTCSAPALKPNFYECLCAPGYGGNFCQNVICGDNLVIGTEVCDDGNTLNNDGCSADCKTVETRYFCPPLDGSITPNVGGKCTLTSQLIVSLTSVCTSILFILKPTAHGFLYRTGTITLVRRLSRCPITARRP
jgi:cysteine-rich repeat protein